MTPVKALPWLPWCVCACLLLAGLLMAGCVSQRHDTVTGVAEVRSLAQVRGDAILRPRHAGARPVLGLALGGGGLRGYAHVGVLLALEEAGVEVGPIAGTSAGAVIGAAYASGRSAADIRQLALQADIGSLTDWRLSTVSFMRGDALERWAAAMAGNTAIEAMPRRFGAVAALIESGEAVLIETGDPGLAIRASAAVPGAMPAVPSARGPLVDGGISSLVPVRFARAMGAEVVIGVDIYCQSPRQQGSSFLTAFAKVAHTQTCLVSRPEMLEADVLIAPSVSVTDMHDAAQRTQAIMAGYQAAKNAMPRILALLDQEPLHKFSLQTSAH